MSDFLRTTLLLGLFLAAPASRGEQAKPLKPVNLAVNTDKDEDDPHTSSTGLHLYYTSTAKGKRDVLVSKRTHTKFPWPAGEPLLDGTGKAEFRSGFVTAEDHFPQFFYFATDHDRTNEKDQKGNNYDIYYLARQIPAADLTGQTPVLAVCTADDEMHPWLTETKGGQKHLYFSRKTKEGWRVFVASTAKGSGAFGKPSVLDLPPGFHHPTLTADGKTMVLQGPLENGRWGLFRATATPKGWDAPEPLESLNNAEGRTGDLSPSLSRDGRMLYFASDRPGGKGGLDLWVIPTMQLPRKK